jgi:hypothetical protein
LGKRRRGGRPTRAAAGALLGKLDEAEKSRTGKEASVTEGEPDWNRAPP